MWDQIPGPFRITISGALLHPDIRGQIVGHVPWSMCMTLVGRKARHEESNGAVNQTTCRGVLPSRRVVVICWRHRLCWFVFLRTGREFMFVHGFDTKVNVFKLQANCGTRFKWKSAYTGGTFGVESKRPLFFEVSALPRAPPPTGSETNAINANMKAWGKIGPSGQGLFHNRVWPFFKGFFEPHVLRFIS